MLRSQGKKDARLKARPPVVETSMEISKSKLRRHSRKPKTFRIEIRPRDCRRPTNTDSGSANGLRTSCVPCRQTQAAPTTHNRHSKKRADCATAESGKNQRRVVRPKPRQRSPYAWSAKGALKQKTPNVQRPTPNAQCRNSERHFAFLSAVRTLEKKILMSSSVSFRIPVIFGAGSIDDLEANRSQRRVSFSSLRQTFSL